MNKLSVVYEAHGSRIMGNAIRVAARETWIGVRDARGRTALSEGDNAVLNTGDFDARGGGAVLV